MGSGKSVVGALVAESTGADFADLDRIVERAAGVTIADIFSTRGESEFRRLEKQSLPNALRPATVVALGGGAVIDDDSWALLSTHALTVYLEAPFEVLWERIRHDRGRPLLAGRPVSHVAALYERRRPRYEQALHRVDGTMAPTHVAAEVVKLWSA